MAFLSDIHQKTGIDACASIRNTLLTNLALLNLIRIQLGIVSFQGMGSVLKKETDESSKDGCELNETKHSRTH